MSAGTLGRSARYDSPLGQLRLAGDDRGLTGLWFLGQKYLPQTPPPPGDLPVFREAAAWLDVYFSGRDPGPTPPLHPAGTPFQREVWALLTAIPYGRTATYGALAARLARERGIPRLSAQAVGGAVGRNPISIFIPCHRVLGAGGSLTGYAGGLDKKAALLALEGIHGPGAAEDPGRVLPMRGEL